MNIRLKSALKELESEVRTLEQSLIKKKVTKGTWPNVNNALNLCDSLLREIRGFRQEMNDLEFD